MAKPPIEYRHKPARITPRKERKVPNLEAASSTPAASAKLEKWYPDPNGQVFASDAATLARIREKTRLRVQKHRASKKASP